MADGTGIEWTDATWNPITGCSVVSAGCTNCYAMRVAGTRLRNHRSRTGLTVRTNAGPVWNGEVRFNEEWLDQPLRWRRPRLIFVCAHGDLFHANVPDAWIDRVFAVMALSPDHRFQVLTKRSERMRRYFAGRPQPRWLDHMRTLAAAHPRPAIVDPRSGGILLETTNGALPHVWLGVSVEDQRTADERIPDLLATPAAVRWLSMEPLLGPVDLSTVIYKPCSNALDGLSMDWSTGAYECCSRCDWSGIGDEAALDWIVVGGESGAKARPMLPEWVRELRDQCAGAGVPFFFKQWGDWAFKTAYAEGGNGQLELDAEPLKFRFLDGIEHNGMPAW